MEKQFNEFYEGFMKVCGGRVMELFKPHELMAVVVGNEDYDWRALEAEAQYKNGYSSSDQTVRFILEKILLNFCFTLKYKYRGYYVIIAFHF